MDLTTTPTATERISSMLNAARAGGPTREEWQRVADECVAGGADVDAHVLALLMVRKGDWKRIADECGGVVSYSWIVKFVNGHIPGAKVDTLKNLRDWLIAHPVQPASTTGEE